MSQERIIKDSAVLPRQQIRIRLDQFKRARQLSPIGPVELAALGVAVVLALVTVFAYLYLLVPARLHFSSAVIDRQRLTEQIKASQRFLNDGLDTKARVEAINGSLIR